MDWRTNRQMHLLSLLTYLDYTFIWTPLEDIVSVLSLYSEQQSVSGHTVLTFVCYIGQGQEKNRRPVGVKHYVRNLEIRRCWELNEVKSALASPTAQPCVCIRLTLELCARLSWDHRFFFFFFLPSRPQLSHDKSVGAGWQSEDCVIIVGIYQPSRSSVSVADQSCAITFCPS